MPHATRSPPPTLLDDVRQGLRLHHSSIHPERSSVAWSIRCARFHGMQSRADLFPAEPKIESCLTDLKDIDGPMQPRTVRSGKGDKDRCTTFPATLTPLLQNHLARVKTLPQQDLAQGHGEVSLPHALARKDPHTATEWGWQSVFPARNLSVDPRSGITRRHHVDPSVINKAIQVAVHRAVLTKHISAPSALDQFPPVYDL